MPSATTSEPRVLIVGFGRHAQRVYWPVLDHLALAGRARLVGIVDLAAESGPVSDRIVSAEVGLTPFLAADAEAIDPDLDNYVNRIRPDVVMICTDPEVHVLYAKWALRRGLHVLVDKPVHMVPGAAHSSAVAQQIHDGYLDLLQVLRAERKKKPNLVCSVLAQRRFHPSFRIVRETIEDVYRQVECPVTYYYSFHSDGQWRLPGEIDRISYHGFNRGYGKGAHSGYHFFDLLNWLTEPYRDNCNVNSLTVDSWGNFPTNYAAQVSERSLRRTLGPTVASRETLDDGPWGLGEIDLLSRVQLKSGSSVVTNATVDLLHSGLSARSWEHIGARDLYKGNGRLRHETMYLNMGPFASISVSSLQGEEFQPEKDIWDDEAGVGHELHLDVHVFRNHELIGGDAVTTHRIADQYSPALQGQSRGHQEDARRLGILEFVGLVTAGSRDSDSDLESHGVSSQLMSLAYQSLSNGAAVTDNLFSRERS